MRGHALRRHSEQRTRRRPAAPDLNAAWRQGLAHLRRGTESSFGLRMLGSRAANRRRFGGMPFGASTARRACEDCRWTAGRVEALEPFTATGARCRQARTGTIENAECRRQELTVNEKRPCLKSLLGDRGPWPPKSWEAGSRIGSGEGTRDERGARCETADGARPSLVGTRAVTLRLAQRRTSKASAACG
jgi:hypothetical protein